ncbi:MAG: flagellar biosynthesis protein FlgD [Thermoguttaceae bacterium]|nr:flagellar biosynthesis protein FlgD [Thermoguttaceae bacterium]
MPTNSIGTEVSQAARTGTSSNSLLNDVNLDDFLKLLIAELQNQDPMSPMDNNQILQQVSQIREIESNSRLTETLESVQLGQAMATASSLIGQYITALTAEGERVSGPVDRVSVIDGQPKLKVGAYEVDLDNIGEILSAPPASAS